VQHSGGLAGIVTLITLVPELKLGIIVLTNQQSGAAFNAVTNSIKDGYLGIKGNDWVKMQLEASQQAQKEADRIKSEADQLTTSGQNAVSTLKAGQILGTYSDKWFGDVIILEKDSKLWLASVRSPRLKGELLAYKGSTFIVKWNDRSFDADAFVRFSTDTDGNATGMKMEAISPLTDFSYDFQDLDFMRKVNVNNGK
jgi:hypothetical protein